MWQRSGDFEPCPLALDDDTAERLLSGRLHPADAPPAYADVARILASLAAPEVPDEAQAAPVMAAFRAAHRPSRVGLRQARRTRVAARAATRVAVLVVLTLLLAGGAVATASGLRGPDLRQRRPIERPPGTMVTTNLTTPTFGGEDATRPNEERAGTPAVNDRCQLGRDSTGADCPSGEAGPPVPTARIGGGAAGKEHAGKEHAGKEQEAAPDRPGQRSSSLDPVQPAEPPGSDGGKPPWPPGSVDYQKGQKRPTGSARECQEGADDQPERSSPSRRPEPIADSGDRQPDDPGCGPGR
jgi:hypothetical protein